MKDTTKVILCGNHQECLSHAREFAISNNFKLTRSNEVRNDNVRYIFFPINGIERLRGMIIDEVSFEGTAPERSNFINVLNFLKMRGITIKQNV